MSKARVKILKQAVNDGSLDEMFAQMTGMKDANIEIIVPKYNCIMAKLTRVHKILCQFGTFKPLRDDFPETVAGLNDINEFAIKLARVIEPNYEFDSEAVTEELSKAFNNRYKELKSHPCIKELFLTCAKMKNYEQNINNKNSLNDRFIISEPGYDLFLFTFSSLNLKALWCNPKITQMVKSYIMHIIHNVFVDIMSIYKLSTSADVNVDKFRGVILESIGDLKKRIPRCDDAFKRIEQAVDLLRNKFDTYYRTSIQAANPSLMMESFIIDVSTQGGASPSLTMQFRKIIQFLQSASNGKKQDPSVKKLFSMLNNNLNMMSNKTGTVPAENVPAEIADVAPAEDAVPAETADADSVETVSAETEAPELEPVKK